MIKVEIPEAKITRTIPENANELNNIQFVYYILLLISKNARIINENELKINMMKELLNIKEKISDLHDYSIQNILHLAKYFDFVDLNEQNFKLDHNPIHHIFVGLQKHELFHWDLRNGFIDISLTALQFVDAHTFYYQYAKTNDEKYLNWLLAALVNHKTYRAENFNKADKYFSKLNIELRVAIFIIFSELINYLFSLSNYKFIFAREGEANKINLGLHDSILSAAKLGYANKFEIEKMPLLQFLDILLKEQIDSIMQLKAGGMKINEISKSTKISMNTLLEII